MSVPQADYDSQSVKDYEAMILEHPSRQVPYTEENSINVDNTSRTSQKRQISVDELKGKSKGKGEKELTKTDTQVEIVNVKTMIEPENVNSPDKTVTEKIDSPEPNP